MDRADAVSLFILNGQYLAAAFWSFEQPLYSAYAQAALQSGNALDRGSTNARFRVFTHLCDSPVKIR
jgi:hypothetical protein